MVHYNKKKIKHKNTNMYEQLYYKTIKVKNISIKNKYKDASKTDNVTEKVIITNNSQLTQQINNNCTIFNVNILAI